MKGKRTASEGSGRKRETGREEGEKSVDTPEVGGRKSRDWLLFAAALHKRHTRLSELNRRRVVCIAFVDVVVKTVSAMDFLLF
jgi:hypothetical protein